MIYLKRKINVGTLIDEIDLFDKKIKGTFPF